jgi:DNA-binding response OmpR family regulator
VVGEGKMDKKIMIVDDEQDILQSLKMVLERNDFQVTAVESGKKCLKEIERGFKGIILMDIMMPGMDGWETIREIVNRGLMKGICVEIITGKGTNDRDKMLGLESFVKDYHTKPIDIETLIASIKRCNMFYLTEID